MLCSFLSRKQFIWLNKLARSISTFAQKCTRPPNGLKLITSIPLKLSKTWAYWNTVEASFFPSYVYTRNWKVEFYPKIWEVSQNAFNSTQLPSKSKKNTQTNFEQHPTRWTNQTIISIIISATESLVP